ncbi:hypothetical protein AB4120_06925 [Cupriavidus sp. 2KB_3]|uniref:hypothetical protein n=1 Tax=Cupriavidus sp. 2KB_3 TaxID=3232980 RepID=UPI003F92D307
MEPNQIQQLWPVFDELSTKAQNTGHPEISLLIDALKMQTELLNSRFGAIEQLLRGVLHKS